MGCLRVAMQLCSWGYLFWGVGNNTSNKLITISIVAVVAVAVLDAVSGGLVLLSTISEGWQSLGTYLSRFGQKHWGNDMERTAYVLQWLHASITHCVVQIV